MQKNEHTALDERAWVIRRSPKVSVVLELEYEGSDAYQKECLKAELCGIAFRNGGLGFR